jgi:flagellar motor component MotA
MMIEGILTVQAGDNPRVVREKLEAQLPPGRRGGGATASNSAPAAKLAA